MRADFLGPTKMGLTTEWRHLHVMYQPAARIILRLVICMCVRINVCIKSIITVLYLINHTILNFMSMEIIFPALAIVMVVV